MERSTPSGTPKQPRRRIQDCAIRQLKNVEKERRIIGRMLSGGALTVDELPVVMTASAQVTDQITKLSQSIRLGAKDEREAMAGLSEAQLDEVFISQLTRLAPKIEPAQRRILIGVWFGDDVAAVLFKEAA